VLEWAGRQRILTPLRAPLRAPLRWLFHRLIGRFEEWPAFQPAYRFKGKMARACPSFSTSATSWPTGIPRRTRWRS
jgi:hypothetical protein